VLTAPEEKAMSCCQTLKQTRPSDEGPSKRVPRRTFIKGVAGVLAGLALGSSGLSFAQTRRVRLAFCSQLLCVVPYEFTRARGFFKAEGLDVELIYTRGGNAAMQALVGGAVEYAGTSFDVALQAFANGAPIERFATTGRLPLFALATAPGTAAAIGGIEALAGRTVGVSALGNADHVLLLFLLQRAGVEVDTVRFATLGPNLYDALRLGQIDAGMVQEPALTLLREAGSRVLFNAMDLADAEAYLGGPYEFMGVAVRSAEKEARLEEMRALARALERGLQALQEAPVAEVIAALPSELVAGGNVAQLEAILAQYRRSLYPDTVVIDLEAAERVQASQLMAGVLEAPVDLGALLALEVVGETP
jgi:NitT/TauT family transport system substrate-binding protein